MIKQINGPEIEREQDTENIYILKVLLMLALILRLDVQVSLTKEGRSLGGVAEASTEARCQVSSKDSQ